MNKNIAIIGLGYVGLPLAILANLKGYKVIGIDLNKEKVDLINKKKAPFVEDYVSINLPKTNIEAINTFEKVSKASIIIICVPTPIYEDRLPNYEPIELACCKIAPYIKKNQLIILESTVNPGVSEELVLPILEKFSGLICGKDFFLAHCPERINPGDKKWGVWNIPRVVGGFNDLSLKKAVKFYKSIIEGEIKPMSSLKEAEAVKITENSFRNINIAFVNELAQSFAKLGIDVVNVINGAATKPFSFMSHYPSCGIGGHCIPIDPYYLIDYASKSGFNHEFLKLSCKINEDMPKYTVNLLNIELNKKFLKKKNTKVTVLGLAYKANIDDCRESPAFEIVKELKKEGYNVTTYDPYVLSKSTVKNLDEALNASKFIILATSHSFFISKITPILLEEKNIEIIIDGKNCLKKEDFINSNIIYKGIGR